MFTLLNANDLSTTGHHEITPACSGVCCSGMIMGGAIIIAFFYFLFQLVPRRESPQASAQMSAVDVLDQWYARGEISKDEYLEQKKHLRE